MSDRLSMLNGSGESSQFVVWGLVSFILHVFIFAGMFFMPELRFTEPQPRVITIDLSSMPSLEPPAKKKGSLPKASPAPSKPAAESGAPAEKEEVPKGDVEKPAPPEPEPKKETPPPPAPKETPKPEPKVEEVKKPKEVEKQKEDVIPTKPKKEVEKPEKKEEKVAESKEVSKEEAKKDTKDEKDTKKDAESKDSNQKDVKDSDKASSSKSDALARMRKKVALEAASRKAGEGVGDGGEEGDPKGSEKGSANGVEGGSEKGGAAGTVADFYLYEIARYLGKNWVFANTLPGAKGLEAHVILKILPSGELKEPPFFEKRSGNSFFDDSVYRTIMKSSPFPSFPGGIKESYVTAAYRFTPEGIK